MKGCLISLINSKIEEILVQIKQTGNLTTAANKLFISQPYISKLIKETEQELNLSLVDTKSKPVTLTYAGNVYLKGLQELSKQSKQLNNTMREISESKSGAITIGMSESIGELILPKLSQMFLAQFPQYRLNVVEHPSKEIEANVLESKIDVYIGLSASYNNQFTYRKMKNVEFGVYGSPISDQFTRHSDFKFLDNQPFIAIDDSMILGDFIKHFLTENQINPHTVISVKNVNTAIQLANENIGYAILPLRKNFDCPVTPIDSRLLTNDLIMGHRKMKNNTPEMMAFLEVAQKYFQIDPKTQTIYDE